MKAKVTVVKEFELGKVKGLDENYRENIQFATTTSSYDTGSYYSDDYADWYYYDLDKSNEEYYEDFYKYIRSKDYNIINVNDTKVLVDENNGNIEIGW